MRELRFDGLSPDGAHLVMAGKDGQKYTVAIDERLEAAVRRDRARIKQVEIEQAGVLRPREIQARIRAGATAEDVAAASGLSLEHIRRFEGPVLTERAWVADQAQSTEVRRSAGDIELGDLVADRLAGQGVDEADIAWDAWRRDDGMWVVIATFPMGPNTHVATWTYDSTSRTMTVADDNARSLSAIDPEGPLHLVAARPALAPVAPLPEEDDEPATIVSPLMRSVRATEEIDEDVDAVEDEARDADALDAEAELVEAELAEEERTEAGLHDPEEEAASLGGEETGDTPVEDERDAGSAEDERDAEAEDGAEAEAEEESDRTAAGPTAGAEDVPLFDTPEQTPPARPGQRRSVPSFDDILFGPGPGN
jgi:hypothetical protein